METTIARCRVLLSAIALMAIYIDPTRPMMLPGLDLRGGALVIDPYTLAVLLAHLCFSVAVWAALARGAVAAETVGDVTTWTDVLFAGMIAAVTEGISSPFYAFFVFAVLTSGFRPGARRAATVVVVAVAMYLSLILVSADQGDGMNFYVMRPVYLGIVGYLIAYLARRRIELEAALRRLEARADRSRIASNLHDGSLQTLIAVSMRLDGCRRLLSERRHDAALADLCALETELVHEYEGLRSFVRDLAEVERPRRRAGRGAEAAVSIDARFAGSAALVDEVLQITREAITNVKRHAGAAAATVSVRAENGAIELAIDDDGVGFPADAAPPWSIASRVEVAGGHLAVDARSPGAHLRITLPGGPARR